MNKFKHRQAKKIILLLCAISGLSTAYYAQATRILTPLETPANEVDALAIEDNIPSYLQKAEQMLKSGQFEVVRLMSKKVLAMQADNITARALLAAAYTGLGEQDRADQEVLKLREMDPSYSGLNIYLAQVYKNNGQLEKAEQLLQESINAKPDNTEPVMSLAALYYQQKKYKEASQLLEELLQQQEINVKDYLNASFMLCRLYLKQKQYEQVIKRATVLIDNYPPIYQGYEFLATAYMQTGKHEKAINVYQDFLRINSEIARPYQELALIYLEQLNDTEKALEYARQAVLKFPDDSKSRDVLGWVLHNNKQYDLAIQQFKSALQLDPGQAVYYYHLGLTELEKGNKKLARQRFTEALGYIKPEQAQEFVTELNNRIKECDQ